MRNIDVRFRHVLTTPAAKIEMDFFEWNLTYAYHIWLNGYPVFRKVEYKYGKNIGVELLEDALETMQDLAFAIDKRYARRKTDDI